MADNDDKLHSPTLTGIHGHELSAEDIHDFLGSVLDDHHHHDDEPSTAINHGHPPPPGLAAITTTSTTTQSCVGSTATADNNISSESKALARTERKRSRERERRNNVNKQFAELTALLRRIEAEEPDEIRLPAYSPSNRVDLIARTVQSLNTLHENNKRRKCELKDLAAQLDVAKKAGEETAAKLKEAMMAPQAMGNNKVMMMVPMLIGGDGGGAVPMMQPWGMPTTTTTTTAAQQQQQQQGPAATFMPSAPPTPAPSSGADNIGTQASSTTGSNATPTVPTATAAGMPWLMPPPPQALPWMMPHSLAVPTATAASGAAAKSDKKTGSGSDSKPVGSNLAHCA